MKHFIFIVLFYVSVNKTLAQNNKDSFPIYDSPKQKRSKNASMVNPVKLSDAHDTTSLIVIGEKIFRSGDSELIRYKKSSLILVSLITDSLSNSGIRKIVIYKLKN